MKSETEKMVEGYREATQKIANFAHDYNEVIENSISLENKIAIGLCQVFLYPARFMLKYNATTRVQKLCRLILLKASVSELPLGGYSIFEQNTGLKESFSDYHNTGDTIKVILGITSSSLIAPIIYAIVYVVSPFVQPITFDYNFAESLFIFSVVLVGLFNFIEYSRLRGKFKERFNNLKNEIRSLK